ncbi:cytochrome P450 [Mycolicibacterium phlei]|uniref:cytochrome P450 n=1 Tax=Mycolicibacterium phlei TaxID=1771 RepID=UPI00058FF8C6|nr:cytochrome P450 [Mycolicibacterium phlei]VEG10329.1 cytochrome P450 [Mycobacteroides chelonae]AMO62224.1 Cytochrome P450 130 [Mycolicibacterium phlei]KXW67907.1 cytochrome P450 [Mycolicibacterium phlei DSM 43072]KXW69934.1 cytochrome P450 [Mycolicibacterium phlei DSM 43070]KXW75389.1 cytochrome P450 [Mycolicibacterium phlei DSM 43071]
MSQTVRLVGDAVRMNVAAAIRTRRRGYTGWTGAINTDYDPQDPATAAQPFDAYRALHRGGRVHYNPRRATFIVAGLDDVRAALRDTDQVTSSQGVTRLRFSAPLAVLTDGDEHARLRRQVQPGFSRGAMESWQEIVEKLAVELVIELLNNPGCDVVTRLAIPMPIRLIAAILGVPDTDLDDFRRWSERGVGLMELKPTITGVADAARSAVAMAALHRYFRRQFAAGRLKGSDTVLGRLLAHNTDGSLTDQQLLLIAIHLLIAGNETTTNLLGGMFDTFARHPDQYDLIRANPDLIPLAVEEHLRFTTPIQNLYRYTRADYRIGDVVIPTGSRVLLSFGAANRDPTVFDEPDEFRADRDPRKHVAFGYGAHMCLGAPLARMEAQAVLRQLVTRVARISPAGPTKWSTHSSLRGPTRLPIHLTPA